MNAAARHWWKNYHRQVQSISVTLYVDRDCWAAWRPRITAFKGSLCLQVGPVSVEVGA